MELKIVQEGQWKPAALGGRNESSIHADILALGGRETEVTWEDVFDGMFIFLFLSSFGMVLSEIPDSGRGGFFARIYHHWHAFFIIYALWISRLLFPLFTPDAENI